MPSAPLTNGSPGSVVKSSSPPSTLAATPAAPAEPSGAVVDALTARATVVGASAAANSSSVPAASSASERGPGHTAVVADAGRRTCSGPRAPDPLGRGATNAVTAMRTPGTAMPTNAAADLENAFIGDSLDRSARTRLR